MSRDLAVENDRALSVLHPQGCVAPQPRCFAEPELATRFRIEVAQLACEIATLEKLLLRGIPLTLSEV